VISQLKWFIGIGVRVCASELNITTVSQANFEKERGRFERERGNFDKERVENETKSVKEN
jgi:hypothetical protein